MSAPETCHHETVIELPILVEEVWKAIAEAIRSDRQQRLQAIFPEQTSQTCA